ncbi:MAG TPA: winged helix-turn-helix transcriptional regulator [Solirubrobacterales bacterium]
MRVLRALETGSSPLLDLRYAAGSPPQSTMRLYMRALSKIGAIERMPRREFPTSVDYAITGTGRSLLEVGRVLDAWLHQAPGGALELGSTEARNAIKPLIEGWSTNIVRALAGRSLSLTELDRLIQRVSYPSLERRLGAMRIVGLVDGHRVEGGSTPYSATDWLRRAVPPFLAAAAWERRYLPDSTSPIGRLDIEAAFLLTIPLLELPKGTSGRCRLAVEVQRGGSPVFAGVLVCIEEGEVTSCAPNLDGEVESWVSGRPRSWLRRLSDGRVEELEVGGDTALAEAVIEALGRTAIKP